MKTILTLQTSSMFFLGGINLLKGIPVEVETDEQSPSTIRMVNRAIESGTILSSEGLFVIDEPVVEDAPAETLETVTEQITEVVTESTPEVKEDVVAAPVKKATTTKKKVTPAKSKAE